MGDFPIGFGRYSLVERLAVGGMAELFVATSPGEHGFQKKVVIKRLLPHLADDETYNAMFIDEAKLTARLVHPKIAQTFELGKVDDALYIAMEHVDGIDVLALLREFAARRRRVEPQLAVWIAHEVLDALDYAHALPDEQGHAMGVVHRDISPSNVLMSLRGDVKLVDFGIARAKDPDRAHKSKSGTLKGKYGYMSPEQVVEQSVDARSDVFSVGVVIAELLTGRRLFAAPNELDVLLMVRDAKLSRLDKYGMDIEPGLNELVRKALRKSADAALAERRRVPRRARRVAVRAAPPDVEQAGRRRRARAARRGRGAPRQGRGHDDLDPRRPGRQVRGGRGGRGAARAQRDRRRADHDDRGRRQHAGDLGQLRRGDRRVGGDEAPGVGQRSRGDRAGRADRLRCRPSPPRRSARRPWARGRAARCRCRR